MRHAVKIIMLVSVLLVWVASISCRTVSDKPTNDKEQQKIKVVVITGGHEFEHDGFFEMFDSFGDVKYVEAQQFDDSETFEDITDWDYDVIVLYNMTQGISEQRRRNFLELLEGGVGVVALHHCIGSFQNWPEYQKIIGAKYYLESAEKDGVVYPQGEYIHDVDIAVQVEDTTHPVTKGIEDFVIHDETYNNCVFEPDNQILLTTSHPRSNKALAWVRNYGGARVCYIQSGHNSGAYNNENYRHIVHNAIKWCANRNQSDSE